ncbi:MarR family winged helix-turn-helix transcriptional regulator [Fontibacillus sp. BL9]|uniref:MarR family winged helix-turn-helix transcriptional regulator n=1 Tax=Fontibacillus sp. BL9 TaxID=3389971 RepID=UPI00397B6B39
MDNPGYLITKASMVLKTSITRRLIPYNVTASQWAVLRDVSSYPDGTMPAKIAERIYADRPTITGVLERLKRKGYIFMKENPDDKRSNLIFLTDHGKSLVNEIEHLSDDILEEALNEVSEHDRTIFVNVLKQIIAKERFQ